MQYRRCKCGKAWRWDSGEVVHDCQGCSECNTTFAQYPSEHRELQPHEYEDYYLSGSTPQPARMCKKCHRIERIAEAS